MMALTTALATTFAHASAAPDVVVRFASGATPVNVTLPTGDYRMALAPTAGPVQDYLRALAAVLQVALVAARGAGRTVALDIDSAGRASLAIDFAGDPPIEIEFATSVWHRLGLNGAKPAPVVTGSVYTYGGLYPVWHLALFAERDSGDWVQRTPTASTETLAGVGYGVTSGITTWTDEVTFGFITRDPTYAASLGQSQTPWEPGPEYLGSLGTLAARRFSVSDLLAGSLGRTCAYARDNWRTLRTSTSERYDLVTIPGRESAAPRVSRLVDRWDAYRRWVVTLVRQQTPTGTRA